ncbi:MAG: hypothetical protein JWM80_2002, partial [Cyanobacteria bacterium RYN_339]|nr:hypothetical protein [Cyanobacteria bacterium RYN_339]
MRVLMSALLVFGMLGCGHVPSSSSMPTDVSALEPLTLPFASLVDPHWDSDVFQAATPEMAVLRSPNDVDTFLARHPRMLAYDSRNKRYWETPMPEPAALRAIDFQVVQAIAFVGGRGTGKSTARIVGVEDRGDRLVVHTARWSDPAPIEPAERPQGFVHVVTVPVSGKPVVFARTLDIALPQGERPLWKAVPAPLSDVATLTKYANWHMNMPPGGSPTITLRTLAWLAANRPELAGSFNMYLPTSQVYVAEAEGNVRIWQLPPTLEPDADVRAMLVMSVEDGHPLGAFSQALGTGAIQSQNPVHWSPLRFVPLHRAIPNPAIDRKWVEAMIRHQFGDSASFEVLETTMKWAKENLQ